MVIGDCWRLGGDILQRDSVDSRGRLVSRGDMTGFIVARDDRTSENGRASDDYGSVKTCHVFTVFMFSSFIIHPLIISAHSLGRDERSTFLSPIMIRCKILPNSRTSAGTLESAAIFCADLKYSSASGRFSLADRIAPAMNCSTAMPCRSAIAKSCLCRKGD